MESRMANCTDAGSWTTRQPKALYMYISPMVASRICWDRRSRAIEFSHIYTQTKKDMLPCDLAPSAASTALSL